MPKLGKFRTPAASDARFAQAWLNSNHYEGANVDEETGSRAPRGHYELWALRWLCFVLFFASISETFEAVTPLIGSDILTVDLQSASAKKFASYDLSIVSTIASLAVLVGCGKRRNALTVFQVLLFMEGLLCLARTVWTYYLYANVTVDDRDSLIVGIISRTVSFLSALAILLGCFIVSRAAKIALRQANSSSVLDSMRGL
jgi:hypothetical protein